jgi:hypothetical protein
MDFNGYTPPRNASNNNEDDNGDFKDPTDTFGPGNHVSESVIRYIKFRFKVNGTADETCFKKCLNVRTRIVVPLVVPIAYYYDDQNLDAHINFTWAARADTTGSMSATLQWATESDTDADSAHDYYVDDGYVSEVSWPMPSNVRVSLIHFPTK